ncbi:MAG: hypothetical protein K6T63_00965 [Alicyclobacillus herbarius]|uniref:hypothetical protein n=1 Tax=Alicyclobacillus herbarius TaxID=122960 RepID=UPI0023578EA9|nr:hypothetical protein [Alicyclobacillus herbarius]MCL6631176.1 hypothetical protein [Alicyclobacillus herbarius]
MVTRAHAARFVGQHVVFRTRDGATHHGILHTVTDGGMYVRAFDGRTTRLANADARASNDVQLLNQLPQSQGDVHEAWWPFFFFPFFALLWLWPWAWWL